MNRFIRYIIGALILASLPAWLYAQQKLISGKIVDANNVPIAGASIMADQTNAGTVSDADGKFRLAIPGNLSVTISFTGYRSITLDSKKMGDDQVLTLTEDVARLDEILVTGLATSEKRKNQVNAIVSISSKQLQGFAPAQTFDAALNGKIPGAYINASNGAPGGGLSVKLRGVTSIYGNTQPLYVVDGVFMDNKATSAGLNSVTAASSGGNSSNQDNPSNRIADLRFQDIENIEVLKGASAAAIYGSKAAAGVILITTKRGKQGATRINFSQDVGFVKVRKLIGTRPLSTEVVQSQGWDINEYTTAAAAGKIYDYEKEMYGETGLMRNTALSVSGSSEKTSFYFAAATKDEDGIIKNTGYKNTSLRLNLDHSINNNIKIGVSSNFINSSADRGLTGNDNAGVTYGVALSSTPGFTELHPDANGVYPRNKYAASNPLETRDKIRNNENINRFVGGVTLNALLLKAGNSLTRLIARGGLDFYNLQTDAQFPSSLQFEAVNKGMSIQGFTKNLNTNYIISVVNEIRPSRTLAFTSSAGITQETESFNNLLNTATQVTAGQTNVDQAGAVNATQFRTKSQDNGIFAQEELSIAEAINVIAGLRFDRSSNNGDPSKYYLYPKVGLSWNLTAMELMSDAIFQNFKLRVAYGAAGNFPAYGSKFTSFLVSNIEGQPGSLVGTQQGLPGIKPERQTEIEAGLDFSILDSKLNMEISVYNKQVFDFLMLNNLPSSSGFTTQWVNAGDLRNRGVEIGLNAQPVARRNIKWNTSVNFWFNRSKVTRLDIAPVQLGGLAGLVAGVFQIEEGKSATQIIGLTNEPEYPESVKVWGDQEPRFQVNTFNEVTFMNKLSLRFLLHWKNGGQNINLTNLQSDFGGTSADFDADKNDNKIADGLDRIMKVGSTSEDFIKNSGYLKFREIGLYYSFDHLPTNVVKGVRVGVSLNNYFTITKYPSYDPEVSNFGAGFSGGVDAIPFPSSKRASLHLSVDF